MTPCAWHSLKIVVAVAAMGFYTTLAQASTGVATLGVRSQDGEDELERRLSAALRTSAKSVQGFEVGDRELALEQMSLAHGCDEPDAKCLGEIARTLTVEKLLFGSVVNASAGYELTLNAFDAASGKLETMNAHNISAELLAPATAVETVTKVLQRLLSGGAPAPAATGTLVVEGGDPNAEVIVDGDTRARLDETGRLSVELPPGNHSVRPAGTEPGDLAERLALIEAGAVHTVSLSSASALAEVPPSLGAEVEQAAPAQPRNLRRMLGWGAVGVGAAFAIATIYSWVRIERINKDDDYTAYRGLYPKGGESDVCAQAARGAQQAVNAGLERKADELCNEASTLETLQYVFLAGAVVGGGVGTYLLLTARDKPNSSGSRALRPAPTSLSLHPRVGAQSAGFAATLTF
jgi:hypothetical protein